MTQPPRPGDPRRKQPPRLASYPPSSPRSSSLLKPRRTTGSASSRGAACGCATAMSMMTKVRLPGPGGPLAAAERVPDQARKTGRPDDLRGRVKFGELPPPPAGYAVAGVHRGDVPERTAHLAGARQEKPFALAHEPAAVLDRPRLSVHLAEQRDIVPAGLFGQLAARAGGKGLAPVQAAARGAPVPPVRPIVVVAHQQDTVARIEHDDPARMPP